MNTASNESGNRWWRAGWVKWVVIVLVFIVGFYVHQDLMGAVAWKKVQREIAAAGESLDPESLVLTPVPEEKNFGALPIFRLSMGSGYLSCHALTSALDKVQYMPNSKRDRYESFDQLPYLGDWQKGEALDRAVVRTELAELCHEPPDSKATSLELLAKLCPALADLRAANATHPECLFPQDPNPSPWEKGVGHITAKVKVSQVLAYEERLALDAGRPELALEDLKLAWKINSGLRKDDSYVAGLVSVIVVSNQMNTIRQGLAEHVWNHRQLAELDLALGSIDFLADFQHSIRGDTLEFMIPVVDELNHDRYTLALAAGGCGGRGTSISPATRLLTYLTWMIPSGWMDQYKADTVAFRMIVLLPVVDASTHRVFPDRDAKMQAWVGTLPSSSYWRNIVNLNCDPLTGSPKKFSYAQVQVDQARLACRLERYRLSQGNYPETLTALESTYGPNPLDPLSGEAYRYKRNADGTYLLYSLGWNQKDDGGNFAGLPAQDAPDWGWLSQPLSP